VTRDKIKESFALPALFSLFALPALFALIHKYFYTFAILRDVSSAGSERMLHTHEVVGSNPSRPTRKIKAFRVYHHGEPFLFARFLHDFYGVFSSETSS
jgi:hypothetical protein